MPDNRTTNPVRSMADDPDRLTRSPVETRPTAVPPSHTLLQRPPRLAACRARDIDTASRSTVFRPIRALARTGNALLLLGGAFIHESGHWGGTLLFSAIKPAQIRMISPIAKWEAPDKFGMASQQSSWLRLLLATFLSAEGTVWFAGSEEGTGHLWPNPGNAPIYSLVSPGRSEMCIAICGPGAQLIWVTFLLAMAYYAWIHSHVVWAILLAISGFINFCAVGENLFPWTKRGAQSDGKIFLSGLRVIGSSRHV